MTPLRERHGGPAMADQEKPKPPGGQQRQDRLAAELRANLQKRKQQARARAATEQDASKEPEA